MTGAPRRPGLSATLAEAVAMVVSAPVVSVLTGLLVAALCAVVLLTTGRTVASERKVLASIDAAGTRTVVVRAEPEAGLDFTVVRRLERLEAVDWVCALGPAVDAHNSRLPAGASVAVRTVVTTDPAALGLPSTSATSVLASSAALEVLGLPDVAGAVALGDGSVLPVVSRLTLPDSLRFLEPLAVQSGAPDSGRVALVVLTVDSPQDVAVVAEATRALLGASDPTKVSVSTSEQLAQLHGVVQGQLGGAGRSLVLGVLGVLVLVVAALLHGLVAIRRKDFGRRRALGATRSLVAVLVVASTAVAASVGALVGAAGTMLALSLSGGPLPPVKFTVAVTILAISAAVLGAIAPAIAASRRDPLTELRVP